MQVGDLVRFKKPLLADDTAWRRTLYPYKFEMGIVLKVGMFGDNTHVMFPSLASEFFTHNLEVISASR